MELIICFPLCSDLRGFWLWLRAVVSQCCCPPPPPFLQAGGVTLLSSELLANATFMVLTPEPSALGWGLLRELVPGRGLGGGRTAVLLCLGDLISLCRFLSLTSHGISRESSVESGTGRKGLTWEGPWEWWAGGALGWSGRRCCRRLVSGDLLCQLLPLVSCGSA